MDYYKDLEIDMHHLDEEWQKQPRLYMNYAEAAVETQTELDDLKDELAVMEAKISLQIRTDSYKLTPKNVKIVEGTISALLAADPTLIEKRKEYNKKKEEVSLLRKAEDSFEQRKKALENLVILQGREYYAEPRDKTGTLRERATNEMEKKLNKLK